MPLTDITDIIAPTATIDSPDSTQFAIDFLTADAGLELTTEQQINRSLSSLRNKVNNYLTEAKRLQEQAINTNNKELVTLINEKIQALENLLAGLDSGTIEKIQTIEGIIAKIPTTELDILSTIDFLIDTLNAEYVRDTLSSSITVSTLVTDGTNGNYYEIAYPFITKSGKTIASLADLNAEVLTTKSVVIDHASNPFVEPSKVVKNETTGIRIYFQSRGVHLRPFPYKTDSTEWNTGSTTYSAPFTLNLDFERVKSGTEIKSFVVPVLNDGTSNATTDQTVGAGN